ncbi:hypothetical protein KXS07_27795 [Inquilinus limosus]|uniref:hypothetical protein n=1 Tax=Inquilinus limosus TaxID=171674 RepID=UPI003F16A30F
MSFAGHLMKTQALSAGRRSSRRAPSFVVLSALAGSIVLMPSVPARAVDGGAPELLLKPRSTEAQILEASQRQVENNSDPALAFSLLLPNDWLKYEPYEPENPDAEGLALLSRYGSRDRRAMLEILAQKLSRELSPADWLDVWLRRNGYTVLDRHAAYAAAGWNADVLATRQVNGRAFIYRISTFKNGDRLYLVFGYAPADAYTGAEEAFVVAANSFRLRDGTDIPAAEPIRSVHLARVLPVSFAFPESWAESRDETAASNQDSVTFKNRAGVRTIGLINVTVSPEAMYASVDALRDGLVSATERTLKSDLPDIPMRPVTMSGTSLTDVRQGEVEVPREGGALSIRITIAKAGRSWVSFFLMGSKPEPDVLLVDAINRRAYDIAVRTFGPAS